MNPYAKYDGKHVKVTFRIMPGHNATEVTEGVLETHGYNNTVFMPCGSIGIANIVSIEETQAVHGGER